MRNLEKQSLLQQTAENSGVSVEFKQLDVQYAASVELCVPEIILQECQIDMLINNAVQALSEQLNRQPKQRLNRYIQPCLNFTLIEPGGVRSDFADSALKQFQSIGGMKDDEYKPVLEKYIDRFLNIR